MSGAGLDDLRREWLMRPGYKAEYEKLAEAFGIASALIAARARAGSTREQVAARMHTTQTVVARLESGRGKPSTRTLERFAEATGSRLRIVLEPAVWAVGVGCVAKGNSPNGLLGEAEGIEVTHGHLVERIGPVQGGGVAS